MTPLQDEVARYFPVMSQKRYLESLIFECGQDGIGRPNKFAQDALEWAIMSGMIKLSYNYAHDVKTIMMAFDVVIESYRHAHTEQTGVMVA